jgi:hypothetical protein
MFGEEDYHHDSTNSSGNSDTIESEEEIEGKEKWRVKGMKSDEQLIKEMKAS